MKKVILLLLVSFFAISLRGQESITIGLVMPHEEFNGINPNAFDLLQTKLEKMLTMSGISSYGGDFVLYPKVNIIEEDLIEGGIKNFFKVKIELTLNIANLTSETLFSSETWSLAGTSERVKSDAVRNAFTQLKGTDPRFKSFMDQTKSKIYRYYEDNKDAIFAKANTLSSTGEYEEAIALLSCYPSQVPGYNEAQTNIYKIYLKYINVNGARILSEARAAYATKDYEGAVNLAAQIDPESDHYKEAKAIIDQVRATINKEQKESNERAMKALEIAADVEKTRINATASVAKAYYNRRVVNYNIVRLY